MSTTSTDDIAGHEFPARLPAIAAEGLGEPIVTVFNLRQLSGGSSRETWSFDAESDDGRLQPLILQRDRSIMSDLLGIGVATEAHVLRAAAEADVPVPGVIASDDPTGSHGAYVLVERVAGETIPQRILRDEQFADTRPRLAGQYGEILGRIQQVPLAGLPALATKIRFSGISGWFARADTFIRCSTWPSGGSRRTGRRRVTRCWSMAITATATGSSVRRVSGR